MKTTKLSVLLFRYSVHPTAPFGKRTEQYVLAGGQYLPCRERSPNARSV